VWRRRARLPADELVAECAAFLRGRYAPYLAGRGRPVPVWAWTSVLAHASEADLHELIRAPRGFAPSAGRWSVACAYVAGDVLDLADEHGSLAALQAAVLIPLELELATRRDIDHWGPRPWVDAITALLGDHRQARERQARTRSRRTGSTTTDHGDMKE
jgi:hypothetical protein